MGNIVATFNTDYGLNYTFGGVQYTLRLGSSNPWIYESPLLETSIPDSSFKDDTTLIDISIPDSVTSIGASAFSGCSSLTGSLTIPSSVTRIGDYAFYGCSSLTGSLTIPSSVTRIGDAVFSVCSGLSSLTIPSSVTTIGTGAFNGCSGLTGSLTIPSSVTSIGISAFNGCSGLTGSLTIPSSVINIGAIAFYGCPRLTQFIFLGSTIPTLGATYGDNYFTIFSDLYQPNIKQGTAYYLSTVTQDDITTINSNFNESYVYPPTVISINPNMGQGGQRVTILGSGFVPLLTSVTIGDVDATGELVNSTTSISVTTPAGVAGPASVIVTTPGGPNTENIFYNYVVPPTVTSITPNTGPLSGNQQVTITGTNFISPVSVMFGGATGTNVVVLGSTGINVTTPAGVTDGSASVIVTTPYGSNTANTLYSYVSSLTITNITPSGGPLEGGQSIIITGTGFYGTPSVTIGGVSVTSVLLDATRISATTPPAPGGATGPATVSVTTSGGTGNITYTYGVTIVATFNKSQSNLTFGGITYILRSGSGTTWIYDSPVNPTSIPNYSFQNKTDLINVSIPSSVTNIGYGGFSRCSGLSSLTIPSSVTIIGDGAFYGCSGLTGSLTIPSSVISIHSRAFSGCSGLTGPLTIPDSVTSIGHYAFSGCSGLTGSLTIPSSVTSIDTFAFYNCSGLTGSLTIPSSVTIIGNGAFNGCPSLTQFTFLGSTIPTLGAKFGSNYFTIFSDLKPNIKQGNVYYLPTVTDIAALNRNFNNVYPILSPTVTSITPNTGPLSGNQQVIITGTNFISPVSVMFGGATGTNVVVLGSTGINVTTPPAPIEITGPATVIVTTPGGTGNIIYTYDLTIVATFNKSQSNLTFGGLTYTLRSGSGTTWIYDSPVNPTSIPNYSFQNKTDLINVSIPSSVTSIGFYAFYNCSGLTGSLTIPSSVTSIGPGAFYNCSGLTGSLTIPSSVTIIVNGAFYGCPSLTQFTFLGSTIPTLGATYGGNYFTIFSDLQPNIKQGNVYYLPTVNQAGINALNSNFNNNTIIVIFYKSQGTSPTFGGLTYTLRSGSGTTWIYESPANPTSIPDSSFNENKELTDVSIPSSVTSIGDYAFFGCLGLNSPLTIPSNVTKIGNYAFAGCSGLIGPLTIPSTVTSIGAYAFNGCSGLTGVLTISSNITIIKVGAFSGCSGLTGSLTIPDSVTSIGGYAFYRCSGLTGTLAFPPNVISIGTFAFYDCSGLTSLILNSVTSIGTFAFYGCSGLNINLAIPSSVTSIGNSAFSGCPNLLQFIFYGSKIPTLGDVSNTIFGGNTKQGNATYLPNVNVTDITALNRNFNSYTLINTIVATFNISQTNLTFGGLSYTLRLGSSNPWIYESPVNPTSIPYNSFISNINLTNVLIPSSVTSIGNSAFENCSGLTGSLIIPSSVTSIGNLAFQGCSGLTGSLTIPSSVTSIGANAFAGCSSLKSLIIPSSVTNISYCAFIGCSGLTGSLTIPDSVTSIGEGAFQGCSKLTSITLGNKVETIGRDAFIDCSGLTGSLTIPSSVTSIGPGAFSGCSGLTGSLTIPSSVTSIGSYAFNGCSNLTGSLTIPSSVQTISANAFSGCSGLTGSLTIPSSVTSIGANAFAGCSGLTGSLTILDSITSIGTSAFSSCPSLTQFTFLGNTIPTLGDDLNTIFGTTKQGTAYYLPSATGIDAINRNFNNKDYISTIIVIFNKKQTNLTFGGFNYTQRSGSSTTWIYDSPVNQISIPNSSFNNNKDLTNISIPSSVTTIGEAAFYECRGLSGQLIIPSSVTSIGANALYRCSGLNGSLTIPSSVTIIEQNAFYGCSGLSGSLTIPSNVTTIGFAAFAGCSGLNGSLTISSGVRSIGVGAFAGCSNLTGSLTIPSSVTSIEFNAFSSCLSLTQFIFLGSTIPTLGNDSNTIFGGSTKQGNATYLSGVNSSDITNKIDKNFVTYGPATTVTSSTNQGQTFTSGGVTYTLYSSSTTAQSRVNLFSAPLTATASLIPSNTFSAPLTATASFSANPIPSLTSRAFAASTDTYKYMSPPDLTSIPADSFTGNTSIIEIQLSDIVQTIGANAFSGCSELTAAVAFPASVTSIGANAFQGTPALTFTFLGDTIPTLGDGTTGIFGTDSQATAYYLPTATNTQALLTSFASSNPIPPPTVTDVYPNTGPAIGGQEVTIIGTNFIDPVSIRVMFGTTSALSISFISETEISVLTPSGSGEIPVIVTTLVDSSVSNPLYTYIPSPIIASITPNTLSTSGGETITITGQNFIEPVTVTMDGTYLSTVSLTDTEIQVISVERSAGPVNITITTPGGSTSSTVIYTVPCFAKGSKILYYNKITKKEEYKVIENLRKGDLVKTLNDGFIPIHMIGYKDIYNASDNHDECMLYKCSRKEYPELFEDLIITGHHSILVDNFKPGEKDSVLRVLGDIFVTNRKYRLPACVDKRATPFLKEGIFTVYHFSLENVNGYKNYGVYANGLLVETISKRYLRDLSSMHFIE